MVAPIIVVTGPPGVGKSTVGRLVAESFDLGVHLRMDDFWPFVVKGWVDPNLPEAAHQNHILGGAAATAAMTFAEGGYAVVLDGLIRTDALPQLGWACTTRAVPLHYAVLRAAVETCAARVAEREGNDQHTDGVRRLHAWYADLGDYERHGVDASGAPDEVAATVLAAHAAGSLRVS